MNRLEYQGSSAMAVAKTWLGRTVLAVVALIMVVGAFFFLTTVLVTGAVLAVAIAVRWWWILRKVRKHMKDSAPLEGEYTVVPNRQITRTTSDR